MANVVRVMWKGVYQLLINYGFIVMLYAIFWGVYDFTQNIFEIFLTALENNSLCEGSIATTLAKGITSWREEDQDSSETETGSDFCSLGLKEMVKNLLVPASLIVILLAFLTKRKNMYLHILGGRPGLPITVNLLDESDKRIAFVAAFGATTTSVIDLFKNDYYFNIPTNETWVKVFVGMVNVAGIGIVFYPIFACIATKNKVVGSFIGFFYTATWVVFWMWQQVACPKAASLTISDKAVYYMTTIPIFLFLFTVLVRFFITSVHSMRRMSTSKATRDKEESMKMNFYQAKYVMHLLKPGGQINEDDEMEVEIMENLGTLSKLWHWIWKYFTKYIYKPVPGFQYSLRAMCTFSVSFHAVYVLACNYFYLGQNALIQYREFVKVIQPLLNITNTTDDFGKTLEDLSQCVNVSFFISAIVAFLMMAVFILRMMASYRGHFLRLCRGDRAFLPPRRPAPTSLMVSCLRYSGYQIGYILWGFIVLLVIIFIATLIIAYQVILPIKVGRKFLFIKKLDFLWPSIVFAVFLYMVQFVLSKFVFLQENGGALALTNRRFFHIMSYFFFFFNVILGLISCLLRAIKGMVFGTLFLSRIDKSTLMREYESLDRGHMAYLSFLQVEVAHCHPVLVTFCKILMHDMKLKRKRGFENNIVLTNSATSKLLKMSKKDRTVTLVTPLMVARSKVSRNRWWMAITLHNNPCLADYRAPKIRLENEMNDKGNDDDDDWVDF
ncbi:stimulated by retinoic acid gene 6 protein-like [Glandiceps talaboti]